LRPTLLNEFRLGYLRANTWNNASVNYNPQLWDITDALLPRALTQGNALVGIGEGIMDFHTDAQTYNWTSHPVGARGNVPNSRGGTDGRWMFADVRSYEPRRTDELPERALERLRRSIERSPSIGVGCLAFDERTKELRRTLGPALPNARPHLNKRLPIPHRGPDFGR
ncbi:MAG: hypothetical protein FWD17_17465, partial [Polyangiaceae bacterium]|nr:hypothetical protein [Polyangiaceae bacterium]